MTTGVDVSTVSRVFGVNVPSVYRLAKEPGFPPKLGPNLWDLNKSLIWYVRYLQALVRRRGPSGGPETALVASQRLRVLKGQAEKIELGNAVQRGEYVTAASVIAIWSRTLIICRARLLGLPAKLAPLLADKSPGYISEEIRRELHAAMIELSNYDAGTYEAEPELPADAETGDDFA
jgi:phage terminase Nu1 subunit (DNA packaging protein)